ncbi:response regulator [Sphingosinicella terrae]|uniref:response regulator n=1 Tax=Sphingosinicella terrae TaxID=2172047 RepID=UPI0013B46C2A|nr:response regulator transcription factor [Sphingosinicella terrae]
MSDRNLIILILEDQGLVRAGMRELIQISEPQARILEASSYEEALVRLEEARVDIAFLDIDLKGARSGLDFLRQLRERELDTRAIMLSGRSDKDVVMECLREGASGYIVKDMESDGLFRRALDTVFQGSVFLPANVIGRGGFSPTPPSTQAPVTAESLGISGRALEALYWVCQGLPNKAIARHMGIEEGTVRKDYLPRLFRIFKVVRRTELLIEVSRRGIHVPRPDSVPPEGGAPAPAPGIRH